MELTTLLDPPCEIKGGSLELGEFKNLGDMHTPADNIDEVSTH